MKLYHCSQTVMSCKGMWVCWLDVKLLCAMLKKFQIWTCLWWHKSWRVIYHTHTHTHTHTHCVCVREELVLVRKLDLELPIEWGDWREKSDMVVVGWLKLKFYHLQDLQDKKTWVIPAFWTYQRWFIVFLFWLSFHTNCHIPAKEGSVLFLR